MSESEKPRSRAHLITMCYPFPPGAKDGAGNALSKLTIREIDTYDMEAAAKLADANKSGGAFDNLAIAVVAVNGKPLITGSIAGWNAIAIEFVGAAYSKLNGLSPKMTDELLAQGEVIPA